MTMEDDKTMPARVEDAFGDSAEVISDTLNDWLSPLEGTPVVYIAVITVALLLLLWILHLVFRFLVIRPLVGNRLINRSKWLKSRDLIATGVLSSIATMLSILCIGAIVDLLPRVGAAYEEGASRVIDALFVFFCAQLIVRAGRFLDLVYSRLPSVDRPGALMGYVSVGAFLV